MLELRRHVGDMTWDTFKALQQKVAALTQEVSQLRAKLQKRDRTETGAKDAAYALPSKKACIDPRASAASEQGALAHAQGY